MPASENAVKLTRLAAEAASDRLARDIVALDVSDHLVITDAFLLCSAPSDRQVRAVVDAIEERLREVVDLRPTRREGEREGRWVLLDYLDLVVHVQHTDEREYYQLERLWRDCPSIELPETVTAGQQPPRQPIPHAGPDQAALPDADGPSAPDALDGSDDEDELDELDELDDDELDAELARVAAGRAASDADDEDELTGDGLAVDRLGDVGPAAGHLAGEAPGSVR